MKSTAESRARRPALSGLVVWVCMMLNLFSTGSSLSAQPVTSLTAALPAPTPVASAGYQCVHYAQPPVKAGQVATVSVRLGGYTVTYSAGATRFNQGLGYPGELIAAEGGHSWVLPRPVDAGGYPVFGLLCALTFQAAQVPVVVTEGWTGGQCCLAPTIYTFSASTGRYVAAEDFMELGVGRGLHWSAFYGFTPVKAGGTVVLKSPDGAFDGEFGCLECGVGPARLFTLAGGRLVDVTVQHPSLIVSDRDSAWASAQRYMRSSSSAGVEGAVAQWAADSCDLRQGGSMWRTLEQLQADGSFDGAELEFGAHEEFASQLRSFLLVHGYCTGQLPAEESTAVPLTIELTQTPYLSGLSCPTASVCYAAGGGVVGSSTDGGRSWAVHTVIAKTHTADAEIADLSDIACPTVSVCYAVIITGGGAGSLVKTTNGWRTWAREVPSKPMPFPSSIACPSANTCFVVSSGGGPPSVFATTDGGLSWVQGGLQLRANSYSFQSISCPNALTCFVTGALGTKGIIARTTNGGAKWSVLPGSEAAHNTFYGGIYCSSPARCLIGKGNMLSSTENGGATWSIQDLPAEVTYAPSVTCAPSGACYALGAHLAETVLLEQHGSTWGPVPLPAMVSSLSALACPAPGHCIAVGSNTSRRGLVLVLAVGQG